MYETPTTFSLNHALEFPEVNAGSAGLYSLTIANHSLFCALVELDKNEGTEIPEKFRTGRDKVNPLTRPDTEELLLMARRSQKIYVESHSRPVSKGNGRCFRRESQC
jgi:hypothetical protein